MIFKFWKWRIEVKIRDMDADKQIAFLGHELLKAVARSGRRIISANGNMASVDVDVYRFNGEGRVHNIQNYWDIPIGKVTCIEWDKKESPAHRPD